MTTEGKHGINGAAPEDDEALWSLLGRQAPPIKVSPYFARRVLREIGLEETPRGGWRARIWRRVWNLAPGRTAAWSGAFALGMLCMTALLAMPGGRSARVGPAPETRSGEPVSSPEAAAVGAEPQGEQLADAAPVQDEEVIADLDSLLSREESRLWTEDTDTVRF